MMPEPFSKPDARASTARDVARLLWLGPSEMIARLPLAKLARSLPGLPPISGVESVTVPTLEARLIEGTDPHAVLSPLFWREGDVLEAARLLWNLGFGGPYRVISPPLPRPGMVLDEVLTHCPGLDLALVETVRVADRDGPGRP